MNKHKDISKITIVKTSLIHGKGLFAAKAITEGQIIGQIVGVKTQTDGPYVLWIDKNNSIEVTGDLKYINHSQKPNACYYDDLTVIALKDIAIGDEITHHYGDEWFD